MNDALKLSEMLSLFVGEQLGSGLSRTVYVNKIDPTTVVKFETNPGHFQNVKEWTTWRWLEHVEQSEWLAPCVSISECGRILIQRRADPLPPRYKLPPRAPSFLTDLKRQNLGLIGGKLVVTDYGFTVPDYPNKLKRVFWENDS